MMKIIIVNPFEGADKLTRVWANEEDKIDFRAEPLKAPAAHCRLPQLNCTNTSNGRLTRK